MGYVLVFIMQGIMSYSWYTSSSEHLNIVTIFYTLVMILSVILFPLMSWLSHSPSELKDELRVSIRKWVNPKLYQRVMGWYIISSTITLMVLCNYTTLVVFYIMAAILVKICSKAANKSV